MHLVRKSEPRRITDPFQDARVEPGASFFLMRSRATVCPYCNAEFGMGTARRRSRNVNWHTKSTSDWPRRLGTSRRKNVLADARVGRNAHGFYPSKCDNFGRAVTRAQCPVPIEIRGKTQGRAFAPGRFTLRLPNKSSALRRCPSSSRNAAEIRSRISAQLPCVSER